MRNDKKGRVIVEKRYLATMYRKEQKQTYSQEPIKSGKNDFMIDAEQGRNDLFALLNLPIKFEDNMQVIYTLKYLFPKAKEVCFGNNSLSDR